MTPQSSNAVCLIPTALSLPSTVLPLPLSFSPSSSLITGTHQNKRGGIDEPDLDVPLVPRQHLRQATSLPLETPSSTRNDSTPRLNPVEPHTSTTTPTASVDGQYPQGNETALQAERSAEQNSEQDDDVSYEGLEKRWQGWETSTSTVFVTNTQEVPTAITIYTTYGENPVVDGGTVTETIYKGASTLTVLGPSYLTLTFYPTTTTWETSKTTVHTATKTKTRSPKPQRTEGQEVCLPGDADKKAKSGLVPTHDQSVTLYVIAISPHSIVGIAIGWNLFILRDLLYPFKVLTVSIHEIGHVFATILLGYRIGFFSIDPKLGGATRIFIGNDREHPLPLAALPAGYLFSIIIGGVLVFCGFNTLASKIASFIVGMSFIGVFLRVGVPAKLMTIGAVGLMIGLWFVDHAWPLRFYILFIGVLSSFYVLWDAADDAFFAKTYPCCPTLFYEQIPALNPGLWTLIWFFVSFLLFVGFVLAGLATFKQSSHAMRCQADTFLPT